MPFESPTQTPNQEESTTTTHKTTEGHSSKSRDSGGDAQSVADGEFMWIKNKRKASGAAAETYREHMERNNSQESSLEEVNKQESEDDQLKNLSLQLDDARVGYVAKRISLREKMRRIGEKLGLDKHAEFFTAANSELDDARAEYADKQKAYYDAIVEKELDDGVDKETAEIFLRSLNVSEGANLIAATDVARMEKHPLGAKMRTGMKSLIDRYRSIDWKRRVAAGAVASIGTGGAFKAFSLASLYSGIKDKLDARADEKKVREVENAVAANDDARRLVDDAIGSRNQFAKKEEQAQKKRQAIAAAAAAGTTIAGSAIADAFSDSGNDPVRGLDALTDPNREILEETDAVRESLRKTYADVQEIVEEGPQASEVDNLIGGVAHTEVPDVSDEDVKEFLTDGSKDTDQNTLHETSSPEEAPLSPKDQKRVDEFLES